MKSEETNELLRSKLKEMIDSGWLKTHIGKILLGPNGQAHLNHFLKEDDLVNDFGVKPLHKIANVVNYDLHLAFIRNDDIESIKQLDDMNYDFFNTLVEDIVEYLNNNANPVNLNRSGSRSQIDSVIDDLLN